ncbi:mitochondrial import inner membrane translocase subunit Tim8 [Penicillium verhagenii]|uniref:mitochondrial import inner membrane translocase subunit Tim8 n=1 Tax=Penicillium verhagenii TaxID=1562060 RepID=UPI0025451315|nr:mitochondrial import inner membrane translocase subunit Tim8 [Penicillium verhagenii]KAJ5927997.1 mitochondrial import inner membrane translocase subunit Tim8 [Penicillium verhagenii]
MDTQAQADLSKLNEADKKELSQFLANESQKANIQQTIHVLADVCFKKCITTHNSNALSNTEEVCAQNCVGRWMDTQISVLKHLENMRQ